MHRGRHRWAGRLRSNRAAATDRPPGDRGRQPAAPPPKRLGVTHWSSRLLASRLGIDHTTVAKAWREYGIAPWREGTFKFSTGPELVAKVVDMGGLYLARPENAVVLCVDEKSHIQAL